MSDVPLIIEELKRISIWGTPESCMDCHYRRICRTDDFEMCLIVKEVKHRLEEWQRYKEVEDDGK